MMMLAIDVVMMKTGDDDVSYWRGNDEDWWL